jgi:opacity protein-like surface antigen
MTRRVLTTILGAATVSMAGSPAWAQEVHPTVFGTIGATYVYRVEDQGFGTGTDIGGGGGIQWKRLGVEVEVHRVMGLTPKTVECAVVNLPCSGSAREGVVDPTLVSGNVSYLFRTGRVAPYVIGSFGAISSTSFNSVTTVTGGVATVSEFSEKDTGLAIGAGVGVDLALTPALSLRPEFRIYSASAMSKTNLNLNRGSVAIRYRF